MNWKLSFPLILVLAMPLWLVAQQTQTKPAVTKPTQTKPAGGESDVSEFKPLIARYYEAWNTLDPEKAAVFYSKEPGLIFYDILPLEYKTWHSYKEGVKKVFEGFSSAKLIPKEDLQVTRRGKIAWTTLTFHLSALKKDGKAMELDCRHTAIWEKKQGKWQIVHEHVSAPLP